MWIQAFIQAWNAACKSNGAAKVVIPPGTYMSGEVFFDGPCICSKPITVEVQGTILAQTDLSEYPNGQWFSIEDVDGVVVTGGGTFNGRGEASWQYDNCGHETVCNSPLPPVSMENFVEKHLFSYFKITLERCFPIFGEFLFS